MPVMLIRVIRDCYVLSDFYDVNRVLFKDGRVLSRFLITGHQTLQAFHMDIGQLIQQGLVNFMEMIYFVDCTPQYVPQMLDGVAVRGLCRLVHFSDVLLLQIISHPPGTMRRRIVILIANIISKMLPSKWYLLPQSYYHVLVATSCYVVKRGTTWLRRSFNVRQRSLSVIKRGRS